jgi:hypothetical protein
VSELAATDGRRPVTGPGAGLVPPAFVTPNPRRVTKVTVRVEGDEGQVVEFTYLAELPDADPDPSAGIELEVATDTQQVPDPYDPFLIRSIRYTHTLRIEKAATWTVTTSPPAGPPT